MIDWLTTYNDFLGMHNAAIFTTIFGAFCVTFVVIICWSKLVEDFGPLGGMMAAALIIGTFWVMNHKLPGFGIHPEQLQNAAGETMQYGLIHQGLRGAAPWTDMGWAIGMGLWMCGLFDAKKEDRPDLAKESMPRMGAVLLGGIVGGGLVGLTGQTGAQLFGWAEMATQAHP